jgi:hypothetical protein
MRSTNKLLKISIENFNLIKKRNMGLCSLPIVLNDDKFIGIRERNKLFNFIRKNKPSEKLNKSFILDTNSIHSMYWWERSEQGYDKRLRFLKFLEYKTRPWYKKLW